RESIFLPYTTLFRSQLKVEWSPSPMSSSSAVRMNAVSFVLKSSMDESRVCKISFIREASVQFKRSFHFKFWNIYFEKGFVFEIRSEEHTSELQSREN